MRASPRVRSRKKTSPPKPTSSSCLKRLGHEVETLAVFDNVAAIVDKLKSYAPDVVFNLSESFHHDRSHEPNIPALLELMKVRYTGAGPDALLLCKDKALAKKVLAYPSRALPAFRGLAPRHIPCAGSRRFKYPGVRQAGGRRVLRRHQPRRRSCATKTRRSSARASSTRNSTATR